jgi:ABC-type multidrug transport system ATPase subunit
VLGCDLVADRRAVRRRVGLLGHTTALYDDLTVEDNVAFAVRAAGASRGAVEPALARLGLAGRLRSVAAGRLSAGQRRRTALAILVARGPELWLLDEPHAGLDAEHRTLLDEIVLTAAAGGAAVLLASHEIDRASALAHRSVTMAGGQVHPVTRAVADPAPAPVPGRPAERPAPPADPDAGMAGIIPSCEAAHVA